MTPHLEILAPKDGGYVLGEGGAKLLPRFDLPPIGQQLQQAASLLHEQCIGQACMDTHKLEADCKDAVWEKKKQA